MTRTIQGQQFGAMEGVTSWAENITFDVSAQRGVVGGVQDRQHKGSAKDHPYPVRTALYPLLGPGCDEHFLGCGYDREYLVGKRQKKNLSRDFFISSQTFSRPKILQSRRLWSEASE